MIVIQPVKFWEMETGFYKIVSRVKYCFETGLILMGFTVASELRQVDRFTFGALEFMNIFWQNFS